MSDYINMDLDLENLLRMQRNIVTMEKTGFECEGGSLTMYCPWDELKTAIYEFWYLALTDEARVRGIEHDVKDRMSYIHQFDIGKTPSEVINVIMMNIGHVETRG